MTFQQLRYLLEVNRTHSVSKAAERFFVSRPSISFSITSVENELGYPIFQRTKDGLVPTRQGKLFLEYARQVCDTHELMTSIDLKKQDHINFAVHDYPPINSAALRLMEECRNRSEVTFSFNILSIDEIIERLARFELDVALFARFKPIHLSIETRMEKRGIQWNILHQIPTVLLIGPGHPLYNKPNLTLRDLENDTFLDTPSKDVTRFHLVQSMMRIPPECVVPCNNVRLKYELINKGLAYTICKLPDKSTIEKYGFRCLPINELSQQLTCAINPARELAPEAKRFIALLNEELSVYKDEM